MVVCEQRPISHSLQGRQVEVGRADVPCQIADDMGIATIQWLGSSPATGKQIDKCHTIMLEGIEPEEAAEVYQNQDEDDEA